MRIGCAFLFSLCGAPVSGLTSSAGVLLAGICFAIAARLPLLPLLKRLLAVNFFIFFLWFFLPFSRPGNPAFSVGPFTATTAGLIYTTVITLKSNGVILAVTSLLSTMPVQLVGAGMQSLKFPDKFCRLFLFTWRYVHVMRVEFSKMRRAAAMRNFVPRTNLRTYKTYAWLMGMLLVRSLDRAQRVWKAMLCRGFSGTFHTLETYRVCERDWGLLAMSLICTAGFLILEFKGIEVFK